MSVILNDSTKFLRLGPVDIYDRTVSNEAKFQRNIVKWVKSGSLSSAVAEIIRPTGSIRPRLYGLPKTHKEGAPLRPILSMIGSSQHKVAKWLAQLLDPVLKFCSNHCVKDSFDFARFIRSFPSTDKFMVSFDVCSLFTCIPILETTDICTDLLYRSHLSPPDIPESTLIELMKFATTSVEFSFNDIMYRQIDGVSMGSPLGPTLANIFMGFWEKKIMSDPNRPVVYFRYVDDTFCLFNGEDEAEAFFLSLNNLHPALQFTLEKEKDKVLSFLDVSVCRLPLGFFTTVYRKPTFTGLYTRWDSFCPTKRKINLIKTLTHRALMICSDSKLDEEIKFISATLCNNGFPLDIVKSVIHHKIADFNKIKPAMVEKCPVYLRLPWLGDISDSFSRQISRSVQDCYYSSNLRVVFKTKPILVPNGKDVLPPPP